MKEKSGDINVLFVAKLDTKNLCWIFAIVTGQLLRRGMVMIVGVVEKKSVWKSQNILIVIS